MMDVIGLICERYAGTDVTDERSGSKSEDDGNMEVGKCLCEPSEVLIFPCSGASNLGQIANEVALRLLRRERARCTAPQALAATCPGS